MEGMPVSNETRTLGSPDPNVGIKADWYFARWYLKPVANNGEKDIKAETEPFPQPLAFDELNTLPGDTKVAAIHIRVANPKSLRYRVTKVWRVGENSVRSSEIIYEGARINNLLVVRGPLVPGKVVSLGLIISLVENHVDKPMLYAGDLEYRFEGQELGPEAEALATAGVPAPEWEAPATAGAPLPAPPVPATAGAPAEDLKEQLQAALTNLRQAQLDKDINGLMSVYSTAFPGYAQKRQEALEYWEGHSFDSLAFAVNKIQAIDSDHVLAWVTWSQDVRDRKTQELSSGTQNLQLRFAKEEGNWRISDLQEAGAEAPAPPAPATPGPTAEALKNQLQAALSTLRQAQLDQDINGLTSVYSTAFPGYAQKCKEALELWEGYDFTNLTFTVDKVQAIDSNHALAWVTWSQDVRDRRTKELSSGVQSLQLRFVKEKGNWRISDLREARAGAPAPPAPAPPSLATAEAPAPAPPAPATAGATAEDLKEQLQAALSTLRQAQLQKDINGLMSVYSTAFPGYAQKRQEALEFWEGHSFDSLAFAVDKVQAIDSDHALAWVTWSQDVRDRKTQELSSGTQSLQLRFAKEEGNWRISDLQEAGAEAPAPPAPAPAAPATAGAPSEDLKEQLEAALTNLRQAQLHKDINGLMSVYSTAFPGYAQKRQEALEYWEGHSFDSLAFAVDKVQAIDSDHALAWVTWSQDIRDRKTQELSSGTRSLQLRFAKEEGNWRISDLQEAGAEAPAPPASAPAAPATAGAPAPAPPALATAGAPAEDLKEQLQAALSNLRQAQLDKDINGLMSVYSTAFPGYAQKLRKDSLEYWEGYNFDYLVITVDKVQPIDSDHALAWVTWSQDVRNRKTQEISSGTRNLQLRFAKEEGNWRISDLQEAGAGAPAPPAPAAAGAIAPAPAAPAAAGAIAPAPPAPATARAPTPAPPAPATPGPTAEALKEQLQAALSTLRQAQLDKDINGLMSVYSTAFPGYAQKLRKDSLEYWEGYNFDYLVITVDRVQAIDSDHALALVTWSQDVRNRKTQELSSGTRNLQLRFAKEEGNWRISDSQEEGAEAPAPPAPATAGAIAPAPAAPAPAAPATAGAPAEDLKGQLKAVLSTLRQAQLQKNINLLEYREGYDLANLAFTVDKVQAIDSDHALAWVTWHLDVRDRKTRELSSVIQKFQVQFVKEEGNWRISDLQKARAEAPAPPAPAPPAPATAGPPAEDLKEQLQAALTNLRQAQLDQDINALMSVYSTAFPGYAQKRKDILKYWKGYQFDHLLITVDKVQAIDSDHALAWVTWSQNVRNRKTQEPSSDIKSLQLRFVKEEGNWRISDLQAGQ
jgi:hypothetical protein